jgi:hypothetical protein
MLLRELCEDAFGSSKRERGVPEWLELTHEDHELFRVIVVDNRG